MPFQLSLTTNSYFSLSLLLLLLHSYIFISAFLFNARYSGLYIIAHLSPVFQNLPLICNDAILSHITLFSSLYFIQLHLLLATIYIFITLAFSCIARRKLKSSTIHRLWPYSKFFSKCIKSIIKFHFYLLNFSVNCQHKSFFLQSYFFLWSNLFQPFIITYYETSNIWFIRFIT